VKATLPIPPESSHRSVTDGIEHSEVTETKKGGIAANPGLKATKALRQAPVKNTQEKVKAGKSSSKIPNPTTLTPPPPQTILSSIQKISDLLDTLPMDACVELTCRRSLKNTSEL
jgi:hypothetical protein